MSGLRAKWEKGARTWRLVRAARALAAGSGRPGPAVLVTNLALLGDVILGAGVVAALRGRHPDSPLLFAGQPRWREVFDGDPACDGYLGAHTLYEVRALARSGVFGRVYVLDIPIPTLLDYLDGTPHIYRYAEPTTGDWFTRGKNLMALYEQNAGLDEGTARPRLWLRPEDQRRAEEALDAGLTRGLGPVIALHTTSSEATKNWPMEHFAALVARWTGEHGARFVVVGGPGEARALSSLPGVTHLAGKLTVKQTGAVIARCDFFVGPDSGLAYVAEAVGTPGLVILGATSAVTCGPRSPRFAFVRDPGACDPACHRVCTRRPFCVTRLPVDAVDRALGAAWDRVRGLESTEEPEDVCASR